MRFCLYHGCKVRIVSGSYCDQHGKRREQESRGSSTARGYDWKWRTQALAFLAEFPLCGMRPGGKLPVMSVCRTEGLVTAGKQVDHVVPHRGDQMLFWDREGNWQTLCAECGARKSQAGL